MTENQFIVIAFLLCLNACRLESTNNYLKDIKDDIKDTKTMYKNSLETKKDQK